MRNMCINNEHLKCLKLQYCGPLENIDILVPGLEYFSYAAWKLDHDKINIRGCKNMKKLELRHVTITDKLIENLHLSGFMLLENLIFEYCSFKLTNSFRLYFENLKSLALIITSRKYDLMTPVLEIRSSNLVSFTYKSDFIMPSIPVSVISSNVHFSANILISRYDMMEDEFQFQKDWRGFLSLFSHFNSLLLEHDFYEVNIIYYHIM